MDLEYFKQEKARAKTLYRKYKKVYSPYFQEDIVLNSKGLYHLQYSKGRLRDPKEQLFKFRCIELGVEVIIKSSTIQEYREVEILDDDNSMQKACFWGMVAIVGSNNLKMRVVLRKVGDGEIHFWSVMPYSRIKNGRQQLYEEGLENG